MLAESARCSGVHRQSAYRWFREGKVTGAASAVGDDLGWGLPGCDRRGAPRSARGCRQL